MQIKVQRLYLRCWTYLQCQTWPIVSQDTGYISTETQSNITLRIRCNIEYTMNFVYSLSIVIGNEVMTMYVLCIPHKA